MLVVMDEPGSHGQLGRVDRLAAILVRRRSTLRVVRARITVATTRPLRHEGYPMANHVYRTTEIVGSSATAM